MVEGGLACASQIANQEHSILASLNAVQATEVAENSSQFQRSLAGNSYEYASLTGDFSLNASTCSVAKLGELSVDFNLLSAAVRDGDSSTSGGLQVWENPSMTEVLGTNVTTTAAITYYPSWSGYEVTDPSGGVNQALLAGDNDYYQPAVSENSNCYAGQPYECDLLVWSGLSYGSGGSGFLLQSGTAGYVTCTSGGTCASPAYQAWWEMVSSYAYTTCSTSTYVVSTGDLITPLEENGLWWSGGTSSQWEAYVIDWTANGGSGWSCASSVLSYSSTAYWGEAILETPGINSYTASLPTFGTVTTELADVCTSPTGPTCMDYYTGQSNPSYVEYEMQNTCSGTPTVNIAESTINGGNTWTSQFQTACGT